MDDSFDSFCVDDGAEHDAELAAAAAGAAADDDVDPSIVFQQQEQPEQQENLYERDRDLEQEQPRAEGRGARGVNRGGESKRAFYQQFGEEKVKKRRVGSAGLLPSFQLPQPEYKHNHDQAQTLPLAPVQVQVQVQVRVAGPVIAGSLELEMAAAGGGAGGAIVVPVLGAIPDAAAVVVAYAQGSAADAAEAAATAAAVTESIVLKRMHYKRKDTGGGGAGGGAPKVVRVKAPGVWKRCKFEGGCEKHAAKGGLCISHGGKHGERKCKFSEGCDKVAQKAGLCKRHFNQHMEGLEKAVKQIQAPIASAAAETAKEKLGDSRMHWKNRMEVLESVVMHQVQGEGGAAAAAALGTSRIVGRGKRKAKSPADDILSSDPYWPTSAGPDLDYGGAGGDDSDADDGFCVACGESDRCRGGICSAGGRAGWRP